MVFRHPRECIFCGDPNLTNEHIFGAWLRDFLPRRLTRERVTVGMHSDPAKVIRRKWSEYKARVVCEGCNTGWMNRYVEHPPQSVLKQLILPKLGTARRVTVREQRAMATWATKVALLFPYTYTNPRGESARRLAALHRRHRPPRGTYVWYATRVGQRQGGGSFPYMEAFNVHGMRTAPSAEVDEVFTFALGFAVFRVLKGPGRPIYPRVSPDPFSGPFIRIWPSPRRSFVWPLPAINFPTLQREARSIPTRP